MLDIHNSLNINDLGGSAPHKPLTISNLQLSLKKDTLTLDFCSFWVYLIDMKHNKELDPILNFQVVAIDRHTGRPQFATISAPSQKDADDFVSDMAPDWIIIRKGNENE
jgi:hypothetical protein